MIETRASMAGSGLVGSRPHSRRVVRKAGEWRHVGSLMNRSGCSGFGLRMFDILCPGWYGIGSVLVRMAGSDEEVATASAVSWFPGSASGISCFGD